MIRSAHRPAAFLALSILLSSFSTMAPSFADDMGAPVPSGADAASTTTALTTKSSANSPASEATTEAAPAPGGSATTGTTNPAASTPGQQAVVLEGNLKIVQIGLQELREVGIDIKRVRQACSQLYEEVSRQPVQIQEEPEIIGCTVVQIPVSFSAGYYLPPRKAWVDMAMANLKPFVEGAKQDVDDFTSGRKVFELPDTTKEKLQPHFKEWASSVDGLSSNLQQLEPLTKGPYYDNEAIAKIVIAMDGQLKDLEKQRHDIYKVIQREAKVETKEEKRDEREAGK